MYSWRIPTRKLVGYASPSLCARVYDALLPVSGNLNESERHALVDDFLTINYLLVDVHEHIERLTVLKVASMCGENV